MARLPVEPETRRMLNQKPAKALRRTISHWPLLQTDQGIE